MSSRVDKFNILCSLLGSDLRDIIDKLNLKIDYYHAK